METPNDNNKTTYTESRKRALDNYRRNHRDKVNSDAMKWYYNQMLHNPTFVEKKREYAKKRYHERKQKDLENGVIKDKGKVGRPRKYTQETLANTVV